MFLSIRKFWPLVHRLRRHHLYLYRVHQAHHPSHKSSSRKEEIRQRRGRPGQVSADVSTNELHDVKLFCACPYSSSYGTSVPDDQSERSNPVSRNDEQITTHNAKALLKRRQLKTFQNKIGSYSEIVTLMTGKFLQNFAPPPRV